VTNTGSGSVRARQVNYKINLTNNMRLRRKRKIIGWYGGGSLRDKAYSEKSRQVVRKEMKPFTDGEHVDE
jgi:Na+-transporting NADH:ubiquinone oxidoreductase subunit NqrF